MKKATSVPIISLTRGHHKFVVYRRDTHLDWLRCSTCGYEKEHLADFWNWEKRSEMYGDDWTTREND